MDNAKNGIHTDKINNNFLNWSEIMDIYEKIKNNENLKNIVFVSLFILQPPRRLQDYQYLKLIYNKPSKLDKNYNYLVLKDKPYFIFNKYKTSSKYGTQKIDINKKLKPLLIKYIENNKINENDIVFNNWSNKTFEQKIKKLFNKYTDKIITINILRHSYISYMTDTNKLKTLNDREQLAYSMAHSVKISLLYYKKENT
jgi:hypothetical protein